MEIARLPPYISGDIDPVIQVNDPNVEILFSPGIGAAPIANDPRPTFKQEGRRSLGKWSILTRRTYAGDRDWRNAENFRRLPANVT